MSLNLLFWCNFEMTVAVQLNSWPKPQNKHATKLTFIQKQLREYVFVCCCCHFLMQSSKTIHSDVRFWAEWTLFGHAQTKCDFQSNICSQVHSSARNVDSKLLSHFLDEPRIFCNSRTVTEVFEDVGLVFGFSFPLLTLLMKYYPDQMHLSGNSDPM